VAERKRSHHAATDTWFCRELPTRLGQKHGEVLRIDVRSVMAQYGPGTLAALAGGLERLPERLDRQRARRAATSLRDHAKEHVGAQLVALLQALSRRSRPDEVHSPPVPSARYQDYLRLTRMKRRPKEK